MTTTRSVPTPAPSSRPAGFPERHLVMACSKSKLDTAATAERLYTGVVWAAWRSAMGIGAGLPLGWRMWVLSARHGLIPSWQRIEPYSCQLTPRRVEALGQRIAQQWQSRFSWYPGSVDDGTEELVVIGGALYQDAIRYAGLPVVGSIDGSLPDEQRGGIGILRQRVGRWAAVLRSDMNSSPAADQAWEAVKTGKYQGVRS